MCKIQVLHRFGEDVGVGAVGVVEASLAAKHVERRRTLSLVVGFEDGAAGDHVAKTCRGVA